MQVLGAPAVVHELHSQPVEQFRMAGAVADHAEVVQAGDDAASEMMVPDAIHPDSRRQRVILRRNPLRQGQPPSGSAAIGPGNLGGRIAVAGHGEKARLHVWSGTERVAANQERRRRHFIGAGALVQETARFFHPDAAFGTAQHVVPGPVRRIAVIAVGDDFHHRRQRRPLCLDLLDAPEQGLPANLVRLRHGGVHLVPRHADGQDLSGQQLLPVAALFFGREHRFQHIGGSWRDIRGPVRPATSASRFPHSRKSRPSCCSSLSAGSDRTCDRGSGRTGSSCPVRPGPGSR